MAAYGKGFTLRNTRDVDQYWHRVRAVPLRSRRSKRDEERYCLGVYLLALATHNLLEFPMRVDEGESPDFMLTASRRTVGLEVTKATEPWFQRAMTEMEGEYKRRESESIPGHEPEPVALLLSQTGWAGDQAEDEWCRHIYSAIARKIAKIENFRAALRHDLLIYDDTPLPAVDRAKAIAKMRPMIRMLKQRAPKLGNVSIILSLDVLFDDGRELRFLPFIDWSAPDLIGDFADRVEYAGRKAVTSHIRGHKHAGMPTYSMDARGRLIKHMPDGRRLEVRVAENGAEIEIGEI